MSTSLRGRTEHLLKQPRPSGYGKSHLASIVIRHLLDKHQSDARVVVAYYYLQRESSDKSSVLNKILKTLIWEVVEKNREYRRAASAVYEPGQHSIDASRTPELWKGLVTALSKKVEMTVFVVVDGIDEIDAENDQPDLIEILKQVNDMMGDNTSPLKVRLLITGTKEALDFVGESTKDALPVDLEGNPETEKPPLNQGDLELYVAYKVDRADRLKDLDAQVKTRITKELAKGARGAYSSLVYLLDELANIQNTNQIDAILQRANQSLPDIIAGKIETLNTNLNKDEIGEINTLLAWLTVSHETLNTLQCEAILSLEADGQSLGLEDRIRKKYSDIFSLSEAAADEPKQITLRAGVEEYLEELSKTTTSQRELALRSQIQPPEVTLVEKVLQTHFRHVFGDDDVFTRFEFRDFFQKKLGDQALRIHFVRGDSKIKVAQGCMTVVCDKFNDKRSEALLTYAFYWFIEHLGLIDINDLEPAVKQDLGRKLTRVLREEPLIEAWWPTTRMYGTKFFVFGDYAIDLLKTIHTWLKDPSIQKGLTDMPGELEWVKSMTDGDKPNFGLYSGIAKLMAKRWFAADSEDDWGAAFGWLVGFTKSVWAIMQLNSQHRLANATAGTGRNTRMGGLDQRCSDTSGGNLGERATWQC